LLPRERGCWHATGASKKAIRHGRQNGECALRNADTRDVAYGSASSVARPL
jgi:hypothetical protein